MQIISPTSHLKSSISVVDVGMREERDGHRDISGKVDEGLRNGKGVKLNARAYKHFPRGSCATLENK